MTRIGKRTRKTSRLTYKKKTYKKSVPRKKKYTKTRGIIDYLPRLSTVVQGIP